MEPCFPPGAIVLDPVLRSAIGEVVETVVKDAYCASKGGCREFLRAPGGPQTDFFDVAMGFHRCRHLAAYLKIHNPHVNEVAVATECESKKLGLFTFPVPDIITHEPPDRLEFYEIKPNSAHGRRAADEKIDWFLAISSRHVFDLPYAPGEKFTPDLRILVWDGTWFGSPAKVRLHVFRDKKARILYEFCIEASLDTLGEMLWKQLLKAVVLALIIIILRTPKPAPTPPPELPAPIPIPIPVPIPRIPVPAFLDPAGGVVSPLRRSVGTNGANRAEDTAYVQLLLGHWLSRRGFIPPAVDGIVGGETIGAIRFAQEEIFGRQVDDLVEPGGRTIGRLEQDHWAAVVESVVLGFDAPLEGELTTEDNEEGFHVAYLPEEAIARSAQDYADAVFATAQEMRG